MGWACALHPGKLLMSILKLSLMLMLMLMLMSMLMLMLIDDIDCDGIYMLLSC